MPRDSANQQWEDRASGLDRRNLLLIASTNILLANQLVVPEAKADFNKVFVAGATGETGRRIVMALRAKGYQVIAGCRDPQKAISLGFGLDKEVEIKQADVTKGPEVLAQAMEDAQAVICATGFSGVNVTKVGSVDEQGTKNLVDAAKAKGISKFVLISSLLTNAKAVGQEDNPNYKFLNLFGGVLDRKLAAEQYLRASGLNYTIVRPGGLAKEPPEEVGNLIVGKEDTLFGLDTDPGRRISRDTVAAVCVAALVQPRADNKVIEVVSSPSAPVLPEDQWFL